MSTLKVNEIFLSIQGEGTRAGLPCTLIRLTGCNLRCRWCDTRYAYDEGQAMDLAVVLARVKEFGCNLVEVTGGEPLAQPVALELMRRLCDDGRQTLVETNGSLDISPVDPRVARIVDVKCPTSGCSESNRLENMAALRGTDEVKFVIGDRGDYEYAACVVRRYELAGICPVIFSPLNPVRTPSTPKSPGTLSAAELARWILDDRLNVRLGMQLHKIIWPDADRGV